MAELRPVVRTGSLDDITHQYVRQRVDSARDWSGGSRRRADTVTSPENPRLEGVVRLIAVHKRIELCIAAMSFDDDDLGFVAMNALRALDLFETEPDGRQEEVS
jgi:hypothetical protein